MRDKIKQLLDSELEDDNLLGWELIEAEKVPYSEVMDYVKNTRIATEFVDKYIWDSTQKKFKKNPYINASKTTYLGSPTSWTTNTGMSLYPGHPYIDPLTNTYKLP